MKFLVWTLIEIITLFVFTGGLFLWLKHRLLTVTPDTDDLATPLNQMPAKSDASNIDTGTYQEPSLTLKQFIHSQMKHAAKQLSLAKQQSKPKKVILIKLWGTLLKAETHILDSAKAEDTEEILKQHLAMILHSIFNAKKDNANLKELEQKLIKLTQSATQSNEVLRLKTELEQAQNTIKKELLVQISSFEGAVSRLDLKRHEQANLELTLLNATSNVDQLKQTLNNLEHVNEFEPFMVQQTSPSQDDVKTDFEKHRANKQINSLNQIANRQQVVIDLLRDKLKESHKEEFINIDESQEVAINRIEQMIKESDSLILQLENELGSTSLSIKTLKSDIDIKSKQLLASEQQLIDAKKTALTSFRETTQMQHSKVEDMKQQLSQTSENTVLMALIKEQQKESSTLESLLKESETCVTLLESELENARKNNQEMTHTIETVDPDFREERDTSSNNKIQQLESQHQTLLTEHSHVKQQLLSCGINDKEKALKNDFNRKKLELDRIQLAIKDLEQKQLNNRLNKDKPVS
jgi:hypothetical protein